MSEDDLMRYTDAGSNYNNPYQFQPVTLVNSVASVALAIIATLLTIALLRSHGRNRQLLEQLAQQES